MTTKKPQRSNYYYLVEMFPYPSGQLHLGHIRNYTIAEVHQQYLKQIGKTVFRPKGWDCFGLPAENAALKNQMHPKVWTDQNVASMSLVLNKMNYEYDGTTLRTDSPEYVIFAQTVFKWLYEAGLIVRQKSLVNWDPVDQTVLANEQVIDGKGWRSGALVEQKVASQWFVNWQAYAFELANHIGLDWPKGVTQAQKMLVNWRKTSFVKGTLVDLNSDELELEVEFKTNKCEEIRIPTDHAISVAYFSQNPKVNWVNHKIETGMHWKHNGWSVPLTIHKFQKTNEPAAYFSRDAPTLELLSDFTRSTHTHSLKPWCLSRQKLWGCQIPIGYCSKCGPVVVIDEKINLERYAKNSYEELLVNPITTSCPTCNGSIKMETDSMDTFWDSSLYLFAYRSFYEKGTYDLELAQPVDFYCGGSEHATSHLMYVRFMTKALNALGKLQFTEPITKLINQGMVLKMSHKDGLGNYVYADQKDAKAYKIEKMSKSKLNTVTVASLIEEYGPEALKLAILSDTPIEKDLVWQDDKVKNSRKLIHKIQAVQKQLIEIKPSELTELNPDEQSLLAIGDKILANHQYNKLIAHIHLLLNQWPKMQNRSAQFKRLLLAATEPLLKTKCPTST